MDFCIKHIKNERNKYKYKINLKYFCNSPVLLLTFYKDRRTILIIPIPAPINPEQAIPAPIYLAAINI